MININQINIRDEYSSNEGCCPICFGICRRKIMSRSKSVEYFCDGCLYSSVYINSELNVHCLVLDNSFYIKYIVVNNDQHSMFICNMKDE
jgi:hypothetical protein